MTTYDLNAPVPPLHVSSHLSDADRLELVRFMIMAREFDHAMIRLYRQGRAFGGVYAQIGNEATSVGASYALDRTTDVIFPMHRDIGMHFVFGAQLKQLMLNFLARQGSQMRGTDGTGHYADPALHIYGNISHLAAMMPVAAGYALAAKMKNEPTVVLTTIGDGGTNVGEFHEAMNFAAVQRVPLIVIIENNQYAYSTPRELEYACRQLSDRAIGYGCPGVTIDGTDVELVYDTVRSFVERARRGEGPALIETVTMRMRGHAEHDDFRYVPRELLQYWEKRDPLLRYEAFLIERGIATKDTLEQWHRDIAAQITAAIDYALEQPYPPAEEAFRNVFV
ncbi:MAG: thiamine pyrophosphate-dependent dehydrogenase E1 component subunit alpha [Bacteroidota bacterium]|nr:thiamine pyrophosphate-dependent dehydrogenase E1 component subunit alpha [Candidatus Kapabacteria bacterium]MCS7302203.1 thiamine pyrophosphate-dependent dehydrogenase E1 component subunit alpha [Candidatus Kapabacteria bacterium]MDW8074823.1 thiamine pyrophosphate-dependent dehydrogenase E1 component subunit alpha [Bacteroidota bacterium]MDW8271462.1 thiamine pyrophosphate-dependent dehydrogenase E1 component subunit alpha [Bacteroidota bacterium]